MNTIGDMQNEKHFYSYYNEFEYKSRFRGIIVKFVINSKSTFIYVRYYHNCFKVIINDAF